MRTLERRTAACLLIGAMTGLVTLGAGANQVAPRPIEAGEWYFGVVGGVERMAATEFKALRLYKNDSSVSTTGKVTLVDPQGYLLNQRIKENEFIPGFHVGYGFGKGPEDSVYRIEFSAEAFNRSESYFTPSQTPPSAGFFVTNNAPPPTLVEVGLTSNFIAIDGKNNSDGSEGGFLFNGQITNELFEIKEYSRSAEVSLYFDSRNGPWVFSRGVTATYSYLLQKIDHEYFAPALIALGPGLSVPGVDDRSGFRYLSKNHTLGSRLHYSVGYEIVEGWSLFTHARVGLLARYTNIKGKQEGPCLTSCDVVGPPLVLTRGTRKININDWKFAYDARMGVGTSARLGPFRLTVHGGGTRVGGATTPRESKTKVVVGTSGGWGYYTSASFDVVF